MRSILILLFIVPTLIMCGPGKKESAKIHMEQKQVYESIIDKQIIWEDICNTGIAIKDCEKAADYWFSIFDFRGKENSIQYVPSD